MSGPGLEITLDAVDAERVAAFWAAALGYTRLYERPPYVVLGPGDGARTPRLVVQRVPAHPPGTRVHLDLRVADPAAECARLVALGATVTRFVDEQDAGGSAWWVLGDPEGTAFCVCPERAG